MRTARDVRSRHGVAPSRQAAVNGVRRRASSSAAISSSCHGMARSARSPAAWHPTILFPF
jgi:hypothetical protein